MRLSDDRFPIDVSIITEMLKACTFSFMKLRLIVGVPYTVVTPDRGVMLPQCVHIGCLTQSAEL